MSNPHRGKTFSVEDSKTLDIKAIGCHYCDNLAFAWAHWIAGLESSEFNSWFMCKPCLDSRGDDYKEGRAIWRKYNFQVINRQPKELTFEARAR